MSLGHNSVASEQLRSYVDRLERIRVEKEALSDDEKSVMAEAKSSGFEPKGIRAVLKIRRMKPHDRAEGEIIVDTYLHALGMESQPSLFRAAGLGGVDTAVRDQVIEAMKAFVPPAGKGDIVINMEGKPHRLIRDKDGNVTVTEVEEMPAAPAAMPSTKRADSKRLPPPDVDGDGAEELGRTAAKENQPIIANPFPFGDERRPRFDTGWRSQSGSDGMGPGDDEDKG